MTNIHKEDPALGMPRTSVVVVTLYRLIGPKSTFSTTTPVYLRVFGAAENLEHCTVDRFGPFDSRIRRCAALLGSSGRSTVGHRVDIRLFRKQTRKHCRAPTVLVYAPNEKTTQTPAFPGHSVQRARPPHPAATTLATSRIRTTLRSPRARDHATHTPPNPSPSLSLSLFLSQGGGAVGDGEVYSKHGWQGLSAAELASAGALPGQAQDLARLAMLHHDTYQGDDEAPTRPNSPLGFIGSVVEEVELSEPLTGARCGSGFRVWRVSRLDQLRGPCGGGGGAEGAAHGSLESGFRYFSVHE